MTINILIASFISAFLGFILAALLAAGDESNYEEGFHDGIQYSTWRKAGEIKKKEESENNQWKYYHG